MIVIFHQRWFSLAELPEENHILLVEFHFCYHRLIIGGTKCTVFVCICHFREVGEEVKTQLNDVSTPASIVLLLLMIYCILWHNVMLWLWLLYVSLVTEYLKIHVIACELLIAVSHLRLILASNTLNKVYVDVDAPLYFSSEGHIHR